MTLPKVGLHRDVPEHEYRAWPATNQSLLKTVASHSPAHARAELLVPRRATPAQELGQAIHSLLLEPNSLEDRFIARPEGVDGRTKEGKSRLAELEAMSAGRTVLAADSYEMLRGITESVLSHPVALDLVTATGITEGSFLWQDDATGQMCKGRFDRLVNFRGRPTVIDLKSTVDASPRKFARSVIDYGYDVQAAWYLHGLSQIAAAERDYLIVAVEKEPPYAIGIYLLDTILLDRGTQIWRRALDQWAAAVSSDVFPAYALEPVVLDAPEWVAREVGLLTS